MELSDETDTRIILLLAGRASRLAIGSQVETREEGGRLGKRNGANEGEESSEWTLRHVESERRWLLFVHGPLQCLSITRAIPRSRSNKTVGRMKPVRDAQCSTALMHRPGMRYAYSYSLTTHFRYLSSVSLFLERFRLKELKDNFTYVYVRFDQFGNFVSAKLVFVQKCKSAEAWNQENFNVCNVKSLFYFS